MFGIIRKYNERGYGFIRITSNPTAEDVFFHVSSLTFPEKQIKPPVPVEFEIGTHKGNPVARNIRLLNSGADDEQQ